MPTPQEPLYREIPLTQGQVTLVDAEDYEWLMNWKWCAAYWENSEAFYAIRGTEWKGKQASFLMHREILGLRKGDRRVADHISRDTLDNRRSNLRIASVSQNLCNSKLRRDNISGRKGVCFDKARGLWRAHLCFEGKRLNLGRFASADLAHECVVAARLEIHGEFARVE
jgi:hypothetical protein